MEKKTKNKTFEPVDGDADEDVGGEEESENPKEGQNPAKGVARRPHHRRRPPYLQRHQQERHLGGKNHKN